MAISIDSKEIERLIERVVHQVRDRMLPTVVAPAPSVNGRGSATGIFGSMDETINAAQQAYQSFRLVSLERRKVFIQAMREAAGSHAEEFAKLTVKETGFGRVEHKVQKCLLAARKTPGVEDLTPLCYTGDDGLTLVEPAPFGVIGAITPCTNPAPTVINNAISMVAAGNAVVFNPHPAARGVSNLAVEVLNQAIHQSGGPANLLCSISQPTIETSQAIMKHPGIKMLMVTGGGVVVKLGMTCGKRCVAAGPGNPPVIVDDTADIHKAARCIVDGASFDNNALCTDEKLVLVFENMADRLISEMAGYGAFQLTGQQTESLCEAVLEPGEPFGHPRKQFVGQDASVLLEQIGLTAGREVRLLIGEVPFEHQLVGTEQLMPLLPIVRVKDLDEALAKAKLAEHGFKHTAMMHSESVSNMSRVAREIETTLFVKNAPSYAGLGFGGEGFATLSIAGPTGEGLTSARTFTRQRRCVLAGAFRIV